MLLQAEAVGLAALTLALAGPVPAALARADWPSRSPRAALFLWQAVGLGGGLGILTAGLTLAAGSVRPHWLEGLLAVPSNWSRLSPLGWFGIALTGCVGAWLFAVTAASTARVLRARRAHRRRLDTIADALRLAPAGTRGRGVDVRLVDHRQAVAYCLPGLHSRIVLSRGALGALTQGELSAILAHEQAHARGHHDLVTQPFIAWARTFPFLPQAHRAVAAVDLLVEMLADDTALRSCRVEDLDASLHRLAETQPPVDTSAGAGLAHRLAARADRLHATTRTLPAPATALIYLAAAALVLLPPAILLSS